MASQAQPESTPRIPLTRDRVLRAAVTLADHGGIESVTMRRVADELGSEAMSLYYHVANKDDLLDGVVDVVAHEINEAVARVDGPTTGAAWKPALRRRILAARGVLLRHKWAPALIQTRATASPAILHYYDALVGLMRDGGFSYDLIHHALHALGSRALGFSPEPFDPSDGAGPEGAGSDEAGTGGAGTGGDAGPLPEDMASQFPHLAGMMMEVAHDDPDSTLGWCDDQFEFEFGLDLILNGLDGLR